MATITPSLIKELRDRTGVGMGKCKEALEEAKGDIELAISNLRKAGMASAVKKEGRATNEGMVAFGESDKGISMVIVNAETDFVVQNDKFRAFVQSIADEVANTQPKSLESFLAQKFSKEPGMTVDQYRSTLIQTIGENIQISRIMAIPKKASNTYGLYSHLGGKIGCLVELEGAGELDLAKGIAMHVAAASPEYVNPEAVPQSIIDNEKDIARDQMKGKPANIIDKILSGKMETYYKEMCLSNQPYIRDDSKTITQIIEERSKVAGKPIKLVSFQRWSI